MLTGERLVELAAQPPLSAKLVRGEVGPELVIVSSAASLLEGDELSIDVELDAGASLVVRSSGAQLAHPCLTGGTTRLSVAVRVGDRCRLIWRPEPLVACSHSHHTTVSRLDLEGSGTAVWLDEFLLGRSGEAVADVDFTSSLVIDRDGSPVLRDGFRTAAAGALGPGGIGANRYVATLIELGPRLDARDGAMELASGDLLYRMVAADSRVRLGAQLADGS